MGCNSSKESDPHVQVPNPARKQSGAGPRAAGDVNVALALRSKRRGILAESTNVDPNFKKNVIPKSEAAKEIIRTALRKNILFNTLRDDEIEDLVNAMEPAQFAAETIVIQQGAKGDNFYVIERGTFHILVDDQKVAVFGDGTDNKSFGELALLYNSPRAATVRSATSAKLWLIDRATFRHIIANSAAQQHQKLKATLRRVPLLSDLSEDQLNQVAKAAQVVTFDAQAPIISKGDIGDVFYIIEKGRVVCKNLPGGQADNVLHAGDYFGERALLRDEPRAADVVAEVDTSLMALYRDDFNKLLGHLHEVLDHNLGMRVLMCVPLFRSLSQEEREQLFTALEPVRFSEGDTIMEEGAACDTFYIIKDGVCTVYDGAGESDLSAGQWFGEKELRNGTAAESTVVAKIPTDCFALNRSSFETLLGPLEELMSRPAAAGGESTSHAPAQDASVLGPEREMLNLRFSDLEQFATLGTGTFGRVKLVHHRASNQTFALKILQKAQVVNLRQQTNIMNEKRLLASVDHPFILRLHQTFKDKHCLYMLLDLVQGGELFSRLQNNDGCVSTDDARFYAACVLDGFEHLHQKYILYRDLKPENLLIDSQGYIKIVDFGFAKVVPDRTYTLCGTPEYLAPELVLGKGHDKGVDYWALGVLVYEMICGYSPFADHQNNDQMMICKNILRGRLVFPQSCSSGTARDCITKLLERDNAKRLGCLKDGAAGVKAHPFFKGVDWASLVTKRVRAPWVPPIRDPLDTSNFDEYDEADDVEPYVDDGTGWEAEF